MDHIIIKCILSSSTLHLLSIILPDPPLIFSYKVELFINIPAQLFAQ